MTSGPAEPVLEPQPIGAAERPRRSKWLVGGAVTAVFAVGAAGIFAVSNLARDPQGGSASADELGLDLLGSIENEDVLGVVDTLLPGERDAFRGPLIDVASELTRLEILSGDFDLSQLAGLDIEFEGETATVRPVAGADDIVNVDLRAAATITLDGADVPIGDLLTDNLPDDALTELRGSRVTTTEDLDVTLTAVRGDDRWYFSAFHTIAELARQEFAPGSQVPATGVGADGTDTPEQAVDQLFDRIEALDITGLIRTLNPGEAAALQRYAPLFLEDAEAALDEVPLEWRITEREVRVEGSGDSRTVFIDTIAIEGTAKGSPFSASAEGSCVAASFEGETFEQCGDGLGNADELFDEMPAVSDLVDTITDAFADIEPVGLELRRHDGLWYVSVTNTVSESFLAVLRALDRQELDAIIAAGVDAFEQAFEMTFDDLAGGLVVDDSVDDLFGDLEIIADEDLGFDVGGDVGDVGEVDDGYYLCYDEAGAAEAAACFESFVASGDMDASLIPVELRFQECGYAEISWTGELYQLSDEDFIAAATSAQSCFLDLVESGQVEAWELPSEITNLECFEGRNWYNVFDDPDYDERYYECVSVALGG